MSYQDRGPQAEDPGDFNQRKRLEAIASAQERARETLFYAESGMTDDSVPTEQLAFSAVKNYAELLRWSIASHGDVKYYRTGLGTIEIAPPDELEELADMRQPSSNGSRRIGNTSRDRLIGNPDIDPKEYHVRGLFPHQNVDTGDTVAFANLPPVVEASWTVHVDVRHHGPQNRTWAASRAIPLSVSWGAFNLINLFLNETGLDVRVKEGGLPGIRGFDQSGDEPRGDLGQGRSDEAPDL